MTIRSFLLLLLAGASSLSAAELVPLALELPKPLFIDTRTPINLPNLERPTGRRPDFLVSAGTVNLSRGRPVTASEAFTVSGELAFLTDGDKTGTDGGCVEFGPGLQWVPIDLGRPARLAAIVLWHFHAQARVYHDVVVQASDDPDFAAGVVTLFNNDHDNSVGLGTGADPAYVETNAGRLIDGRGTPARYVRLFSNANPTDELNHYVEVEVDGQ